MVVAVLIHGLLIDYDIMDEYVYMGGNLQPEAAMHLLRIYPFGILIGTLIVTLMDLSFSDTF